MQASESVIQAILYTSEKMDLGLIVMNAPTDKNGTSSLLTIASQTG